MQLPFQILGKNPNKLWKLILASVAIIAFFFIFSLIYINTLKYALPSRITHNISEFLSGTDTPEFPALFFALMSFIALLGSVFLTIYIFYKRTPFSLIIPFAKTDYAQNLITAFFMGAFFVVIYMTLSEFIFQLLLDNDNSSINYIWDPQKWIVWIIPLSLATLIQTSGEELLFRGFLQQYLASITKRKFIYIGIVSALWAGLHIGNIEGDYLGPAAVFQIFILGIILGDLVERQNHLIGAIGIHFMNNWVLFVLVSNSLEPTNTSIWETDLSKISDLTLAIYTVISAFVILGLYLILRDRLFKREIQNL